MDSATAPQKRAPMASQKQDVNMDLISSAVNAISLLTAIMSFIYLTYNNYMFVKEWEKDELANNMPTTRRWRLISLSLLSQKLSSRCKMRRNKIYLSIVFFLLSSFLLGAVAQWAE